MGVWTPNKYSRDHRESHVFWPEYLWYCVVGAIAYLQLQYERPRPTIPKNKVEGYSLDCGGGAQQEHHEVSDEEKML
jgi:hypothetical protein